MKYLISTNVGDFIVTKNKTATTWLKELHQQYPKMKTLWVYDSEGDWISSAEVKNGKVVEGFYCPDGAIRVWVVWACSVFENNAFCKDFEQAYDKVLHIEKCCYNPYPQHYETLKERFEDADNYPLDKFQY